MAFRVGQKVVFVIDELSADSRVNPGSFWVPNWPKKGGVYTIREITSIGDIPSLRLEEVVNPIRDFSNGYLEASFGARRFRPVVSTDTGMAILEQIRRDVTNKELHPICYDEQF